MAMFYHGNRGWYCRRCVKFGDVPLPEDTSRIVDSEYRLKFSLTDRQKEISEKLCSYVNNGKSVLLEAVCGAGKTEIIYEMISQQLNEGKKVGFAIARRQVVIEIAERLASSFPHLTVICQGHTDVVMGDLVVCTTHQLYRYRNYFDVLIIDEPDAFPYKGNDTLKGIARHSCKGVMVYLTATPDQQLKDLAESGKYSYLYLSKRPHGHDLCVPEVVYGSKWILIIRGVSWLRKQLEKSKKVLIFVPSRRTGRKLFFLLKRFISCCHVDSLSKERDAVIENFKNGRYAVCVATSVLERGVTIYDVQVLVWLADSEVFDEAALVQIAGRVGRNARAPEGECLFLASRRRQTIDSCVRGIKRANAD